MPLHRRTMPSRPFDRLPNEVLLHVFIKGAEDDCHDPWRGGSYRRFKTFARRARQVCARWKTIIDNPPSSVSFWVTYLELTAHSSGYQGVQSFGKLQSFGKQIATFHRLLLSSYGCDLSISFNLYDLPKKLPNDRSYPYTSPIVRLIIYAMEMITPYHDQVIELHMYHATPAVCLCMLKLVATRWTNTSRLLAVTFETIAYMPTELSLSSLPGYDKILSETSNEVCLPLSLAHFCHLDTLMIPAGLWITWGVLMPPNLQQLHLEFSDDVALAKLFGFLQTQMNSFESLRSVKIQKVQDAEAEEIEDQEQAKRPTGQLLGRINLPSLHRISLEGFLPRNVLGFLEIFSCPSLEDLYIGLIGHEEINQSSLLLDFPSEFSRLTTIKLGLDVESWQCLHYLEIFASLPIQQLRVSFGKYEPYWVDHLVSFRTTLSNLRLQDFIISTAPYWIDHYLLASMDTQNLTKLVIDRATALNLERFLPMNLDLEIIAPHLKELQFSCSEDHFIHFLSHLEATQLVHFGYLSIEFASSDWDRERALQVLSTKSFASVRSADLVLFHVDHLLPHLVHLFPKLDQLQIRIKTRKDYVMDDDVILHLIRDVIQPLCDTLASTITTVPLPHLRSISGVCFGLTEAKWSDVTREEVRRMLQEMLTSRTKGGGLPLQMKSIHLVDGSTKHKPAYVKFEACEAPSVIEINSP